MQKKTQFSTLRAPCDFHWAKPRGSFSASFARRTNNSLCTRVSDIYSHCSRRYSGSSDMCAPMGKIESIDEVRSKRAETAKGPDSDIVCCIPISVQVRRPVSSPCECTDSSDGSSFKSRAPAITILVRNRRAGVRTFQSDREFWKTHHIFVAGKACVVETVVRVFIPFTPGSCACGLLVKVRANLPEAIWGMIDRLAASQASLGDCRVEAARPFGGRIAKLVHPTHLCLACELTGLRIKCPAAVDGAGGVRKEECAWLCRSEGNMCSAE